MPKRHTEVVVRVIRDKSGMAIVFAGLAETSDFCIRGPPMLQIDLFGPVRVTLADQPVPLVSSRKTRALLGRLMLSAHPLRRDHLCDLFWGVPDDPRGALRWSLSKIRAAVNRDGIQRLVTDRDTVCFDDGGARIDVRRIQDAARDGTPTAADLTAAWETARAPLLADCQLPSLVDYSEWLEGQRAEQRRVRARIAARMATNAALPPAERLEWALRWRDDAPGDPEAVQAALALGPAGLQPSDPRAFQAGPPPSNLPKIPAQQVHFIRTKDGSSIAWAGVGDARHPPLVKAANWLTHLELDWESPIWSPIFRDLAQDRRVVRYDERGCGLSDWNVPEISFDAFVSDLEEVVDAIGLERFPLLGISQGAAVSIEYSVRHPERVSHLILFGGYPVGWRHVATESEVREREAVMVLTQSGWGRSDPTYRRLFSRTFMPDATREELDWFDEFQRQTTSPANAVRFLQAFSTLDVRHRLPEVTVPTLVLHSRGDRRIPVETGRAIAATIPGATFRSIESNGHLLMGREPGSAAFVAAVRDFIAT